MGKQVSARSAGLNQSVIYGQLVGEPERRELPSGVVAASFSLTVRRPGIKTTSVPIVWYDPPKGFDGWMIGDMIVAIGPVVRRFYHGGGKLGSVTEVVVERASKLGPGARRAAPVAKAIAALQAFLDQLSNLDDSATKSGDVR